MAKIIPSLEKIKQFSVKPEEGELCLLEFLNKSLDDTFEVYFNPYMNGDRPDVVIMKKGQGVMIIEVKDYNLSKYELDERKNWKLINRSHDYTIKSPISQALKYKNNLFELHIEDLLEMKIKDIRKFNMVSCAVYFHNATEIDIRNFLVKPFEEEEKYLDFLKYNVDLLGKDSLKIKEFKLILRNRYLISKKPSFFFTDKIYESFKRFLKPSIHLKEQGIKINYSREQFKIIYNSNNEQLRINGVVGSGKTTVLAARAVQAYKRTKGKVLILTYNITLRNYIRDKISLVREEFPWDSFVILNYHFFINAELNNLGIPVTVPDGFSKWDAKNKDIYFEKEYYSNKLLFKKNIKDIKQYDVVLIDEIQDYKREWMDIIKDYFLKPNGEYILFGDVKQNIYKNITDKKDVITNVKGKPIRLNSCYRCNFKIKDLAIEYQKDVFKDKYEIDKFNKKLLERELPFANNKEGSVNYIYLQDINSKISLYNIIHENAINKGVPPNDITILSETIGFLREFDVFYRYSSNERTNTMFETKEIIYKMIFNFFKKESLSPWIHEAFKLIKREKDKNKTRAFNQLSILFTLVDLNKTYKNRFENKLDFYCRKYKTTKNDLLKFITRNKEEFKSLKNHFNSGELSNNLKIIRNNKKIHFFMNSGTIKLSTIHSFKGWESELLFLIIEPKNNLYSDYENSFDEIIYTGLTRCRSNLVIINYGNEYYHEELKKLVGEVNS